MIAIAAYLHFAKIWRIKNEIIDFKGLHVLRLRDLNVGVFDWNLVPIYIS